MTSDLRLVHYDAAETLTLGKAIKGVYLASHTDLQDNPWYSPEQFWQRLEELYAPIPDFDLVAGWVDGQMVGYAFGTPYARPETIWPKALTVFPELAHIHTPPTAYIFREFATHPAYQGRGYGRSIHDALLANRPEPLGYLLVRIGNPAKAVYESWGWRVIGEKQPFIDSPRMEEMGRVGRRRGATYYSS